MDLLDVWQQIREDLPESEDEEAVEVYGNPLDEGTLAFAERLIRGYGEQQSRVNDLLEGVLEGWSFPQMAQTDLNVLRVAVTEHLIDPATPGPVIIEMAVRIAKKFGGEESGRFVNGVLARYWRLDSPAPQG